MLFNSISFILFFMIVVGLNYICPVKWRVLFLLAMSWIMYITWLPKHLLVLIGIILISYMDAIAISKVSSERIKKILLGGGIIICIGCLILFKYLKFFLNIYTQIGFGKIGTVDAFDWGIPVGLSFFTLQAVGYMIDVFRKKYLPERNFIHYSLFLSFFPQIAAGPIARGDLILPQLRNLKKEPDRIAFKEGLSLLFIGYFKKIVLADTLSIYVNGVYSNLEIVSGLSVLIAVFVYSFVIYFDFSGYSDIAIGCGKLLGIDLMVNFYVPYASTSIKQFWANWHISLSSWLRDYIYFPLGGGKHGKCRKYINIFIIFLVSGLWHGAAWTFVIWGGIHGIYRVCEEMFIRESFVRRIRPYVNFLLISFAWIFFRAESVHKALEIISSIGNKWTDILTDYSMVMADQVFRSQTFNLFYLLTVMICLWIGLRIDRVSLRIGKGNYSGLADFLKQKYITIYYMGMMIIFYFILQNGMFAQTGQFIYFEF